MLTIDVIRPSPQATSEKHYLTSIFPEVREIRCLQGFGPLKRMRDMCEDTRYTFSIIVSLTWSLLSYPGRGWPRLMFSSQWNDISTSVIDFSMSSILWPVSLPYLRCICNVCSQWLERYPHGLEQWIEMDPSDLYLQTRFSFLFWVFFINVSSH